MSKKKWVNQTAGDVKTIGGVIRNDDTRTVANVVNYNAQILKDALNRIAELEKAIKLKPESDDFDRMIEGLWNATESEKKLMKVFREIETETDCLQVGDRIEVSFSGEKHFATAIQQRGDAMLFLTDDYLDDPMRMNPTDTTEGGWKESELRKRLQDIADNIDIKDQLIPFENEDFLTILSIQEMFGLDEKFNECEGQIEWLKDRRHRIAERKGDSYEWGRLRSVVSVSRFALVDYIGDATHAGASNAGGVRPAFQIKI